MEAGGAARARDRIRAMSQNGYGLILRILSMRISILMLILTPILRRMPMRRLILITDADTDTETKSKIKIYSETWTCIHIHTDVETSTKTKAKKKRRN